MANPYRFKLERNKGHADQMCFRGKDVPVEVMRVVRWIVRNQYIDQEDYKQNQRVSPFLQGYEERYNWILVEFWMGDEDKCRAYIDYVNKRIEEEIGG